MKHFLLSLLVFLCMPAFAGVENMVGQCEAVMRCDVCRIEKDANDHPDGVWTVIQTPKGPQRRHIEGADYDWIRNAGDAKTPEGRYVMCVRVEEAMKAPESGRGLAARSLFNANWIPMDYCPPAAQRR